MLLRSPRAGRTGTALALGALALTLTACSSDEPEQAVPASRSDVSPLAFRSCSEASCTGELGGAAYQVEMPTTWNGTLLLWSHGYRSAISAPPDFRPVNRAAEDAPSREVAEALLAQGYALAGSAYATNGWAVQDGVQAAEDLHEHFAKEIGTPRRTYAWGASLGGLITQLVSEKHPDWVSGAAPECGAVAGTTENLDGALTVAYMVKTLIDPGLQITGYTSSQQAVAAFQRAQASITKAAQDVAGGGTAKVVAIASLGDLAVQTKTYDGHDVVSQVSAKAEDLITAMAFATFGQQEFATRVGGQGLDLSGLDLTKVSDDDRSAVKALGGDLDAMVVALTEGQKPVVDPAAREKAREQGEPTGKVGHPTVTLHDTQDPLVIPQNERVLGDRFYANDRLGNLLQLFSKPPATYAAPAPYGAGHCNFTTAEQVGLVKVLDSWVRTGERPSVQEAVAMVGEPSGLDPAYYPLPFPLQAK